MKSCRTLWLGPVLAAIILVPVSGPLFSTELLSARVVKDDFEGSWPSPERWFVCERDENEFRIEEVTEKNFHAFRSIVHPTPKTPALTAGGHSSCRDQEGNYERDKFERAELWEADHVWEKFGTEVWYSFSMHIDPNIPADHDNRLVIGQWKQSVSYPNDHSPIIAQRFKFRRFAITIEQDNLMPHRHPQDISCRITVATDFEPPISLLSNRWKSVSKSEPNDVQLASIGLDYLGKVHGTGGPCENDLEVERINPLPSPFGQWIRMLYHIKATADRNGILEIWANGKPIVSVRGRIGYKDSRPGFQYFKFGPYRNPAQYDTYALIAKFGRGPSRQDAE